MVIDRDNLLTDSLICNYNFFAPNWFAPDIFGGLIFLLNLIFFWTEDLEGMKILKRKFGQIYGTFCLVCWLSVYLMSCLLIVLSIDCLLELSCIFIVCLWSDCLLIVCTTSDCQCPCQGVDRDWERARVKRLRKSLRVSLNESLSEGISKGILLELGELCPVGAC